MKPTQTIHSVATTASMVTALSVAERGLGFLYRIVLSRLIGAEGLGLYQVALSLFSLFLTIGTGGIPITVSRMISKSKAEQTPQDEHSAVSAGVLLSVLLTIPICLFFIPFGGKLSFLFSDGRGFLVFKILLFGLLFSSLYAVLRGSFWGNKRFLLSSVLEIAEETVMVIVGVLLLQNVTSPIDGAQRAAWAAVLSYLFSFAAATLCFFFSGGKLSSPKKQLKPLFNAALPITSVRASASLVSSAVSVLLPAMLMRAGYESGEALTLLGIVSGMVMPVLFIPSTIIGSLALVLVPTLSEDFYGNRHDRLQKNIERGVGFSFLIACSLIPFFFVLGDDVGRIAFANEAAGSMIMRSAPILLPISLTMISTSILNSMGFEKQSFLFYFAGAAALLLSVLVLPAVCGGYAYVIGLGLNFTLISVCNLIFLYKKCPFFKKQWRQVCVQKISPLLFILIFSSITGNLISRIISRYTGAFLSIFLTGIFVGALILSLYFAFGILKFSMRRFRKKNRAFNKHA